MCEQLYKNFNNELFQHLGKDIDFFTFNEECQVIETNKIEYKPPVTKHVKATQDKGK